MKDAKKIRNEICTKFTELRINNPEVDKMLSKAFKDIELAIEKAARSCEYKTYLCIRYPKSNCKSAGSNLYYRMFKLRINDRLQGCGYNVVEANDCWGSDCKENLDPYFWIAISWENETDMKIQKGY